MATLFEYWNTLGADSYFLMDAQSWECQTFTPQVAHSLTSIKLYGYRSGSPGTITVSIKAVDGTGAPTGSALSTGTYNGNSLPTSGSATWFEITMSAYSLSVGVEYAIIIAPAASYLYIRYNETGGYSRGTTWGSDDAGVTWVHDEPEDILFEEYGNPTFIPRVIIF